jgi:hypothetical protein
MVCAIDEVATDLGCLPNDPVGFIQKFYGWGLSLIGLVGLLFLIYGGYHVLTSGGNPEKLKTGKEYIVYSIIGLLLAFFGFVFIQFIAGGILRVPGFE